MLGDATAAAEPKPAEAFQLPMLLDQQEMRLTAPQQTSTLLVGRSGTGKTSIAIEKLYRTAAANAHRAAALRLGGGGAGGAGGDAGGAGGDGLAPHVNVLFVCRSRTLCSQVQRHLTLTLTLALALALALTLALTPTPTPTRCRGTSSSCSSHAYVT